MNDPGFDPQVLGQWFGVGTKALELFQKARALLPQGKERDDLDEKIKEAGEALERSNAMLAKGFGYNLCQCKLPPSIMLWKQRQEAYVCQNVECGRTIETGGSIIFTPEYF